MVRNKKSAGFSFLVNVLLLIFAFILMVSVLIVKARTLDTATQENLCRGFNGLVKDIELDTPGPDVGFRLRAPKACNTIDKIGANSIPTKAYRDKFKDRNVAALTEIRDDTRKCWWMWLEGTVKNMFDNPIYSFETPGFICYSFELDDKVDTLPLGDFQKRLDEFYYGVDQSDNCGPLGGGLCETDCGIYSDGEYSNLRTREVPSDKCPTKNKPNNKKCCVVSKRNYECVNKGGKCTSSCQAGFKPFGGWECPKRDGAHDTCCVKDGGFATYLDYIQGTGGADTGPGYLVYALGPNKDYGQMTDDEARSMEEFRVGERYAITFISPGKQATAGTALAGAGMVAGVGLGVGGASIGVTVGGTIGTFIAPGVGTIIGAGIGWTVSRLGTALAVYSTAAIANSGVVRDISYMTITPYETVQFKYAETTNKLEDDRN